MSVKNPDKTALYKTREAAKRLNVAPGTLQNWRCLGKGPIATRLGRAVRYREEDLEHFIAQGRAAK